MKKQKLKYIPDSGLAEIIGEEMKKSWKEREKEKRMQLLDHCIQEMQRKLDEDRPRLIKSIEAKLAEKWERGEHHLDAPFMPSIPPLDEDKP